MSLSEFLTQRESFDEKDGRAHAFRVVTVATFSVRAPSENITHHERIKKAMEKTKTLTEQVEKAEKKLDRAQTHLHY